ncbi:hypothetical protein LBMAG21_16950 [Armatimonadota bacterium]|nr:hypothetical protein LBMAG21_16950 [Armatimonadota bacterium]
MGIGRKPNASVINKMIPKRILSPPLFFSRVICGVPRTYLHA